MSRLKYLIGISAGLSLACALPVLAQKNLDVYLLIGQSNMAGRATMIASDSLNPIPGTWLFKDSNTWVSATSPLNRYSTLETGSSKNQVGPGFGFATELRRLLPQTEFGLVVNAKGGSSINSWAKGTSYYRDAVTRARQGAKSGKLKGILWHQGESDSTDMTYLDKLVTLMTSLRKDLGDTSLLVIAGQIGQFDPSFAGFNSRILKLPGRLSHCAVVKSDSLVDKGDQLHFDRPSQITLGKRYAAATWDLIYQNPVSIFPNRAEFSQPQKKVTFTNGQAQISLLKKNKNTFSTADALGRYPINKAVFTHR
jgi:hypothetical protein